MRCINFIITKFVENWILYISHFIKVKEINSWIILLIEWFIYTLMHVSVIRYNDQKKCWEIFLTKLFALYKEAILSCMTHVYWHAGCSISIDYLLYIFGSIWIYFFLNNDDIFLMKYCLRRIQNYRAKIDVLKQL